MNKRLKKKKGLIKNKTKLETIFMMRTVNIARDGLWDRRFIEFLENNNFDGYGFYEGKELKEYETDRGGFENDIFLINPYYWGEDEDIIKQPNFLYKPTGYEIEWYKYPMRGAYSNKDISFNKYLDILKHCQESMEEMIINKIER